MSLFDGKYTVSLDKPATALLTRIGDALLRSAVAQEKLLAWLTQPPRPNEFTLEVVSHILVGGKNMLKFRVPLPAIDTSNPNNNDIKTRKLTVTIGSADPISIDADPATAAVEDDRFVGIAGDVVKLSLVDTDGTNPSPAREESATLTDTIAPAQPGDFTAEVTAQV